MYHYFQFGDFFFFRCNLWKHTIEIILLLSLGSHNYSTSVCCSSRFLIISGKHILSARRRKALQIRIVAFFILRTTLYVSASPANIGFSVLRQFQGPCTFLAFRPPPQMGSTFIIATDRSALPTRRYFIFGRLEVVTRSSYENPVFQSDREF